MKEIKLIIMLIMGSVITLFPNSLLTILLLGIGGYLLITGGNALVSALRLIKYKKGIGVESIKALIFTLLGCVVLFNSPQIARFLSGFLFVIIGVVLLVIGAVAISRSRDASSGIVLVVTGLLISLFPLGVSFFITRVIGVVLIVVSSFLLFKKRA